MPTFNTDQFTFNPNTFTYVSEASTLGMRSTPHTLTLVSKRTGAFAEFAWVCTDRDREDEVTGWHFEPTSEAVRLHPGLKGYNMRIFND